MSTSRVPGSGPGRKPAITKNASSAAAAAPAVRGRRNPLGKRYPVWSVRWLFAAFVIGVILTVVIVLLFDHDHRRPIVEMEITLTAVALFMFAFLAVGLYYGARIRKKEKVHGDLNLVGHGDVLKDNAGCLDVADFSSIGDGCGEAIGGLIAGIVLLILLIIGIWLFINVSLIVIFLLALAVGWIFHRAIRQVFSKSRRCRGDLVNSLFYAAVYTLMYTGWLFIILWATDYLMKRHKPPTVVSQHILKAAPLSAS